MTVVRVLWMVAAALLVAGAAAQEDSDDVGGAVLPSGVLAQSVESAVSGKGDAVAGDVVVRDWARSLDLTTVRERRERC
jgi:hypothetical protein